MKTYQDFLIEKGKNRITDFVTELINQHKTSEIVRTALEADAYDKEQNITVNEFVNWIYASNGRKVENFTASNLKVTSNFFNRLNTQRTVYSLGNGVTFADKRTKERLGKNFDTVLKKAARYSLIHGVSFILFNLDHCNYFKITEFAPLYDETTGILRAGVRYYQLDSSRPLTAVLYEEDGYTVYRTEGEEGVLKELEPKRAYKQIVRKIPADSEAEVIGESNYGSIPIVPLWGSDLHQSTLIGMKSKIDSYDLIRSGFANDIRDCAQIYWLISGALGVSDADIQKFRDRMLLEHIAVIDADNSSATPHTQDVPYQARSAYLSEIKNQIYTDFGGLDVTEFSGGNKTATEIDAAYQPMDENADEFEYQIIETVQAILALIGIEDTPIFKRNRISNQLEQVQMVMSEAEYLDEETVLKKLPNITDDEIEAILKKKDAEDADRMSFQQSDEEDEEGAENTENAQETA